MAHIKHPQINGKLERLHGEIQRTLYCFEASSYDSAVKNTESGHVGGSFHTEPAKPVLDKFMERHNYRRAHMPLDWENREMPAQAFIRKMAPAGETVIDEQIGDIECLARIMIRLYDLSLKDEFMDSATGDMQESQVNTSLASSILPWKYTVPYEEGLAETIGASCGRC